MIIFEVCKLLFGENMFITFEGIDGCGKTTQIRLLEKFLNDQKIETCVLREPGGLHLSEQIRSLLLDSDEDIQPITELLLFSAARNHLVYNVIKPKLDAGVVVLCDRFFDSTTAYQGFGGSVSLEYINVLNNIATLGIMPDLTFFLDVSVETGDKRAEKRHKDRIEKRGKEYFEKVRNGFIALAEKYPQRIKRISSENGIDVVAEIIRKYTEETMKETSKL